MYFVCLIYSFDLFIHLPFVSFHFMYLFVLYVYLFCVFFALCACLPCAFIFVREFYGLNVYTIVLGLFSCSFLLF